MKHTSQIITAPVGRLLNFLISEFNEAGGMLIVWCFLKALMLFVMVFIIAFAWCVLGN